MIFTGPLSPFPGLTLRAYALFTATGGVLTQVLNGGITVARTGVGVYTLTFAANMPDAAYILDAGASDYLSVGPSFLSARVVGSCTLNTLNLAGSAAAEVQGHMWVGIYR